MSACSQKEKFDIEARERAPLTCRPVYLLYAVAKTDFGWNHGCWGKDDATVL